jgi:tetratricopeptide (TPR) repeat protein
MTLLATLLLSALASGQELPPTDSAARPASVTSTDSTNAAIAIEAGLVAYKRRQFAQAETHFQHALEAEPKNPAAAYFLGYSIYKRVEKRRNHPDKARALEFFDKAFTLDPAFRPNWGAAGGPAPKAARAAARSKGKAAAPPAAQ